MKLLCISWRCAVFCDVWHLLLWDESQSSHTHHHQRLVFLSHVLNHKSPVDRFHWGVLRLGIRNYWHHLWRHRYLAWEPTSCHLPVINLEPLPMQAYFRLYWLKSSSLLNECITTIYQPFLLHFVFNIRVLFSSWVSLYVGAGSVSSTYNNVRFQSKSDFKFHQSALTQL